jgi:hypothetical protein
MIAPLLIAAAAVPALIALWLVAWLFGDLFAGPASATVRVRSDNRPR